MICAALLSAVLSADSQPPKPAPDPRWHSLDKALAEAQETQDLSVVKEELAKFFSSPEQDVKDVGVRWLGHVRERLTSEQRDDLGMLFIRLNPGSSSSYGFRVEMATRHLEESSVDKRKATYLSAIRSGSVKLESVEELSRASALSRAAFEGMEYFKPLVEQYADEINQRAPRSGYLRSDELLWYLRLRAGAKDRADAMRLHARQLSGMDDERFAELMKRDKAFRVATTTCLEHACAKPFSEACLDFARVTIRQGKLCEEQSGGEEDRRPWVKCDWVEGFRHATGPARVKIYRERRGQ